MRKKIKRTLKEQVIFSSKEVVCVISFILCCIIIILCYYKDENELTECYRINYAQKHVKREIILRKTSQDLWMLLPENEYISETVKKDLCWEEEVTNFVANNMKPGEVVVELGAHIGYFTNLFAKLVTKTGKVYAYEANDEVADLTKLSLKLNELSDIVNLKCVGIADKVDVVDFNFNPLYNDAGFVNSGGAHIVSKNSSDPERKMKKICTTTLDKDLYFVNQIDWLKMDIEGSEILAIKGAKRLIESSPNLKIIMEWAPIMLRSFGNVEQLIDYFTKIGFSFYELQEDGILGKELTKKDLLGVYSIVNVVLLRKNSRKL